jgi:hypothetical protein
VLMGGLLGREDVVLPYPWLMRHALMRNLVSGAAAAPCCS